MSAIGNRAGALFATVTLLAATLAGQAPAQDLARAIPPGAHLFVHAKHNPERDYQAQYYADVWQTVCDEKIGERFLAIISERMNEDKREQAAALWDEVKAAAASIDFAALAKADEMVMFQSFEVPVNQTTVLLKLSPDAAAGCEQGIVELMKLVERRSGGKVPVTTTKFGDASVTSFGLPPEVPIRPSVARRGNVLAVSLSETQLKTALEMLADSAADSKMDDPRVVEALAQLPEPEDVFVFFDGKLLFERLHGVADFITAQAHSDEKAERFAHVFNAIIDEVAILDYEATSQYTDGMQCRTSVYGKIADDADDRLLYKAIAAAGEPFTDWHKWVPADATSYSLSTGLNLHVLYAGIMEFVDREFPEASDGLAKFAEAQDKLDVHLDADVLQSFPGGYVSVSFPLEQADGTTRSQSVAAHRCANPEKVKELVHRAIEGAKNVPFLAAQQLDLTPCDSLEGFDELECSLLTMAGARPVVGFEDGWMICASSPAAAEHFLAVRHGEAASIEGAESLARFNMKADGPVATVGYSDVGASVRQTADAIEKAGAMAPMILGMASAKAKPEAVKPVMDMLGLLPSVAKVIRKFDFFEEQLTITQPGPKPHTYVRESVLLVREPAAVKTAAK